MNVRRRAGFKQASIKRVELRPDVAYLTEMIHRLFAIMGWLSLAFIVFVTLSPIGDRPSLASPHLERFAAFALMGLAFALAYPNRVLLVVAVVVGAAFGLEALQLLTPDRHGRAADALAKALGGISGISIGQMVYFLLRLKPVRSDHSI
jgi:hypothetical protein